MRKAKSSSPGTKSRTEAPAKSGRPRDPRVRHAILKAARELIDSQGAGQLTVEAVAARAGVGKPTIYRNWANAQELALSVFLTHAETEETTRAERGAPLAAFRALIHDLVTRLKTPRGRQMTLMLAAAETDSELFKAFRNRVILDTRKDGVESLQRAMKDGALSPAADADLICDLVLGAIFFRLLLSHDRLDPRAVDAVLDSALGPVSAPARSRRRGAPRP